MRRLERYSRQYERDGFVVIPEVLSPQELADFADNEPKRPPWGNGPQPLQRFRGSPHWRRLVSNDRILDVLFHLLGAPPRVVEAIYLPKPVAQKGSASSQGVAFHRDFDHIRTDHATLIGCWIALNDTDMENGGLCVVPGSHVSEPKLLADATTSARGSDIKNEMRDRDGRVWLDRFNSGKFRCLDPDQILPLTVPSGAAVFFHGSLVHGSFPNISEDRDRLVASIHYVAEGTWVFRTDIQDTMGFPRFNNSPRLPFRTASPPRRKSRALPT